MASEWTDAEIRRVGYLVVDLIAKHLTDIRDQPVFSPVPREVAERFLSTPAPRTGESADEILSEFGAAIEPYPFGNGHPRFWGWVNSPPSVMGIFADALAAAMNPSCAGGNHAAIYVERQVIAWFRELLGFPTTAMGLLTSGGSMATLTALAVARHTKTGLDVRADGLRGAPNRFAFYASSQGHSCIRKAVELLGFGSGSMRTIGGDAIDLQPRAAVHPQRGQRDRSLRIAVVQRVRISADARVSCAEGLDDDEARGAGRDPRQSRREHRARSISRRTRARDAAARARGAARPQRRMLLPPRRRGSESWAARAAPAVGRCVSHQHRIGRPIRPPSLHRQRPQHAQRCRPDDRDGCPNRRRAHQRNCRRISLSWRRASRVACRTDARASRITSRYACRSARRSSVRARKISRRASATALRAAHRP